MGEDAHGSWKTVSPNPRLLKLFLIILGHWTIYHFLKLILFSSMVRILQRQIFFYPI
jgi:hypothetical protein